MSVARQEAVIEAIKAGVRGIGKGARVWPASLNRLAEYANQFHTVTEIPKDAEQLNYFPAFEVIDGESEDLGLTAQDGVFDDTWMLWLAIYVMAADADEETDSDIPQRLRSTKDDIFMFLSKDPSLGLPAVHVTPRRVEKYWDMSSNVGTQFILLAVKMDYLTIR